MRRVIKVDKNEQSRNNDDAPDGKCEGQPEIFGFLELLAAYELLLDLFNVVAEIINRDSDGLFLRLSLLD